MLWFSGMMLATDCDTEVDLCYSMPCANGGTCIPHESGYVCQCTQDFQGTYMFCDLDGMSGGCLGSLLSVFPE